MGSSRRSTGCESRPPLKGVRLAVTRYVLPPKFEQITGYSVKAIERKVESGAWREGHEYRRAPDGHIIVDLKGYEKWVERGRQA